GARLVFKFLAVTIPRARRRLKVLCSFQVMG
ncbi:MAG: hypothetical protein ACI81V_001574, partial [Lentimonas sp.]